MTITYTDQVATCRGLGCFWKLLFRWKGSIYKLLWPNVIMFTVCYFSLSITYRMILSQPQRDYFEKISLHCQTYMNLIPVSFVLGFYVAIVVGRWWNQYLSIPWPDSLALYVRTLITGQNERSRLIRRTIMRYANLSILMTLRMICPAVKKRFMTMGHLVESGFLTLDEQAAFESMSLRTSHPNYWKPLMWAADVVALAKKEGCIQDYFSAITLVNEIKKIRSDCGSLLSYDWISVPLVYTQVTTLAVYVYFIASLMGNQYLDPLKGYPTHPIDLVFPIFTFLQFFFHMGWLMVAETLVNPFGDDDDDFDVNWMIDRNLQVSYVIVDEMDEENPKLTKDQYWNDIFPTVLPYTEDTKHLQVAPFMGSTQMIGVRSEHSHIKANVNDGRSGDERKVDVRETNKDDTLKGLAKTPSNRTQQYNKNVYLSDDNYNFSAESLISYTDYNIMPIQSRTSTRTQPTQKSIKPSPDNSGDDTFDED